MGVKMILKRIVAAAMAVAMVGLLSACAGSVAAPDTVAAMPATTKASLKLIALNGEAGSGVAMTNVDISRIVDEVKAEITAKHPDIWVSGSTPAAPTVANVKIVFTQYDDGNAFARFMLMGLGQIHIDGTVTFSDAASGKQIAQYNVSKDFAFGGLYGGVTRIEDVEKGFARSVAAILDTQQSSMLARMPAS